jgi:hypothetical protein
MDTEILPHIQSGHYAVSASPPLLGDYLAIWLHRDGTAPLLSKSHTRTHHIRACYTPTNRPLNSIDCANTNISGGKELMEEDESWIHLAQDMISSIW